MVNVVWAPMQKAADRRKNVWVVEAESESSGHIRTLVRYGNTAPAVTCVVNMF